MCRPQQHDCAASHTRHQCTRHTDRSFDEVAVITTWYKFRGAYSKLATLPTEPRAREVVAFPIGLALGATKALPELFAAAGATFAHDEMTLLSAMRALVRAIEQWGARL